MSPYFSDRQRGPRPRTNETIDAAVWGGIYATVSALLSNGSFGYAFPETCPDGYGIVGHDSRAFELMLKAEHPNVPFSLPLDEVPDTLRSSTFLNLSLALSASRSKVRTTRSSGTTISALIAKPVLPTSLGRSTASSHAMASRMS